MILYFPIVVDMIPSVAFRYTLCLSQYQYQYQTVLRVLQLSRKINKIFYIQFIQISIVCTHSQKRILLFEICIIGKHQSNKGISIHQYRNVSRRYEMSHPFSIAISIELLSEQYGLPPVVIFHIIAEYENVDGFVAIHFLRNNAK